MPPILDPNKTVRILTKNFLDADTTIVSSHAGTTSYLWDRDVNTLWQTAGFMARRDQTEITLTITFNVGTVETQFTANTIMFLNNNLNFVKLESWNGSAWEEVFQDYVPAASHDHVWYFGERTTSRMRITMLGTKQENKQKEIGELVIARTRYLMSTGMTSFQANYKQKVSMYEVADGGLRIAYTRAPGSRVARYGAVVTFDRITREDYEFLLALKNEGEPFLWYPESAQYPGEVWLVQWVNPFTAMYSHQMTTAGYTVTMELQEI